MGGTRLLLALLWCTSVFGRKLTEEEDRYIQLYNRNHGDRKTRLILDQAHLTIFNNETEDVHVYAQTTECYKCELMFIAKIEPNTGNTIIVNTTFYTSMEFAFVGALGGRDQLCVSVTKFREGGDYWLFANQRTPNTCDLFITNDPMAAEMPILFVAIGILVLWVVVKVAAIMYRKKKIAKQSYTMTTENGATSSRIEMTGHSDNKTDQKPEETLTTTHNKRQRLRCLDTFRGLSLVIMIFVNFEGGGYWFFEHAHWNGLTVGDLVFPWFVFIMGSSMNYSFRSMFKRQKSRLWILWKVIRRSAILFGLGILLNTNWGPVELKTMRIPGVLQRLALSYLIVALMETAFARKQDSHQEAKWAGIRDIVLYIPEWLISLSLLTVHLCLTFLLPVPGCPTGYLGPGGLHDNKKHENCTGGAAGYIDAMVLGYNHLYTNPTPLAVYQTKVPYDPEGILGLLTAIFLCFLGLQAGRIFIIYKEHKSRLIRLVVWAVITGAIGTGLCEGLQNEGVIPVNKNLWSVSFTFITASFGYILLAALYVIIDILQFWDGDPFIFPGINPLVIYLAHELLYRCFPVNWIIDRQHWKLLLKAVWDVLIFIFIAFVLYTKKIFIAL